MGKLFGSSWKTSLVGYLGGLAMLFGSWIAPDGSRAPGAPPITTGNIVQAAAIILLGRLAKDTNVTGGSESNTTH